MLVVAFVTGINHFCDVRCIGTGNSDLTIFIRGNTDFQIRYVLIDIDVEITAIVIRVDNYVAIRIAELLCLSFNGDEANKTKE